MARSCSIDGCGRPTLARGWCITHYRRWQSHGDPLYTGRRRRPVVSTEARFWARVVKTTEPPECWIMGKLRGSRRYGSILVDGRHVRAHRYAYELAYGPIPDGLVICHRCDNPPCVRPEHLWAGTGRDNVRDAASKGRFRSRLASLPPSRKKLQMWPKRTWAKVEFVGVSGRPELIEEALGL